MIRLVAFLALAGALAGAAVWVYLRSELPVGARLPLAALRSAALVLLLALLFNARLPWGRAGEDAPRWALLDVSASMSVRRVRPSVFPRPAGVFARSPEPLSFPSASLCSA